MRLLALRPILESVHVVVSTTGTMGSTRFSFKDPLRFGVATPGGALAAAELDEVSALAGERPSMVLRDFLQSPPLAEMSAVRARVAVPLAFYLAAQPDVMGFAWFHLQKEADWRINSSPSSAFALNAALLARRS
ncbi:hypothetical protein QFZ70_002763 [Arthrobacter sp. V1I9]|jgi:hypothetical protein|nr:hypothetical protein [Arthrobacter sp. V1I9]